MLLSRLRSLREERGLTQKELAEALQISQAALGNYERGERSPDAELLVKLASYFSTSTDYLLGISNIKDFNADEFIQCCENVSHSDKIKIQKLVTNLIQELSTYSNRSLPTEFLALKELTVDSLINLLKGFRVVRYRAFETFKTRLIQPEKYSDYLQSIDIHGMVEPINDVLRVIEMSLPAVLSRYFMQPVIELMNGITTRRFAIKILGTDEVKNIDIVELAELVENHIKFDII